MNIWIDAQLSPSLAAWINRSFDKLNAQSVRALGLRNATDIEIFKQAREQKAIVMTKDSDFAKLIELYGAPPKILLITCGNTSNAIMRKILSKHLLNALNILSTEETLVEISGY